MSNDLIWINYTQQIKKNLEGMKVGDVRRARWQPKTKYQYQCALPSVVKKYFKGMRFKTKSSPTGELFVSRIA